MRIHVTADGRWTHPASYSSRLAADDCSTPADSNARRIAKSLALVSAVWFSFSSARRNGGNA
jgi:hypothetical protein